VAKLQKPLLIFCTAYGHRDHYYVSSDDWGEYDWLYERLERKGFEVQPFTPDWAHIGAAVMWPLEMMSSAMELGSGRRRLVLGGFSTGALFALLAAYQIEQHYPFVDVGVLLASLSPYADGRIYHALRNPASDTRMMTPAEIDRLGRMQVKPVKGRVLSFSGTQEVDYVRDMQFVVAEMPQAKLVSVPCGHRVLDERYMRAIEGEIDWLLEPSQRPKQRRRADRPDPLYALGIDPELMLRRARAVRAAYLRRAAVGQAEALRGDG
jgi:hypothetical protein